MTEPSLILASSSPQRRALLQQIGFDPLCIAADIDETRLPDEAAAEYVRRLSLEKCQVVADSHRDAVVVGSDTTISIGDQILGKPANLHDATETLLLLSDTQHSVFTGVTVALQGRYESIISETKVEFGVITTEEIRAYWESGEPQGKAGSYAIQGRGALFVRSIHGSYSNVVGLPLHEVAALLKRFGQIALG